VSTLDRDAAIADGRSPTLGLGMSVLAAGGRSATFGAHRGDAPPCGHMKKMAFGKRSV